MSAPHDPDCIFCKIVAGQIPSRKVYEDEDLFVFHDIHPWAPVHFLMVPKAHIPSMAQVGPEHERRIDHGELGRARRAAHVVPGGALGERLGDDVGGDVRAVGVRPIGLVEHVAGRRLRPGQRDGHHGRGEHDALDARLLGSLEHAHRALAGRADDLVGVPRVLERKRRRYVL